MVLSVTESASNIKAVEKELTALKKRAVFVAELISDLQVQTDTHLVLNSTQSQSVLSDTPVSSSQDQNRLLESDLQHNKDRDSGKNTIIKFPKNLPVWKDNLSVVAFFEDTESVHLAHGTNPDLWVRGLVNQTSGESRRWTTRSLVKPQVSWEEAKQLFSEHFGSFDAPGLAMDKLVSVCQKPKQSVSAYRDIALSLAHTANVSIDEQWIVRSWSNNLLPHLQKELSRKREVYKRYTFDEISSLALFIEHQLSLHSVDRPRDSRKGSSRTSSRSKHDAKVTHNSSKTICSFCKKPGHTESKCWQKKQKTSRFNPHGHPRGSCYQCGSTDHMRSECPDLQDSKNKTNHKTRSENAGTKPKVRKVRVSDSEFESGKPVGIPCNGGKPCNHVRRKKVEPPSDKAITKYRRLRKKDFEVSKSEKDNIDKDCQSGNPLFFCSIVQSIDDVESYEWDSESDGFPDLLSDTDSGSDSEGSSRLSTPEPFDGDLSGDTNSLFYTSNNNATHTNPTLSCSMIRCSNTVQMEAVDQTNRNSELNPNHCSVVDSNEILTSFKIKHQVEPLKHSSSQSVFRLTGSNKLRSFNTSKGESASESKCLIAPTVVAKTKVMALLDSGSEISAIDESLVEELSLPIIPHQNRVSTLVLAVQGHEVKRIGYVEVPIQFGKKSFPSIKLEVMKLGPDTKLLFGLDLWPKLGLRVEGLPSNFPADPGENKNGSLGLDILDAGTSLHDYVDSLWGKQDQCPQSVIERLMQEIENVVESNRQLDPRSRCTHPSAVVRLDTGSEKPVYRPQYPVPQTLEPVVTAKVEDWINSRVIVRAPHNSDWNSPLLVVRKRDHLGNWTKHRVCIDPRAINNLLPDSNLAVPRISDLFNKLRGFHIASSLDLKDGYHQFPIYPEHRIKTTFTWKGKRYMFDGVPFGFKPITQQFQSTMEQIMEPCLEFVIIFVDDILVFSRSIEEHFEHLKLVIKRLTKFNLKLNFEKCHFGYSRLRVLGHVVSGVARTPDPKKLTTMGEYPAPKTGKQVEALLGFVNYLRDYIPLYSTIAAPLEKLRKVKDVTKVWDGSCQTALVTFRNVLSHSPLIEFPRDGIPYIVATDASQYGVGAVLFQHYEDRDHFISFVSKSLNKSQRNYSATRRELLAIIFALKRFYCYLYGTTFELRTDHRALTFLFTQKHVNFMLLNWMEVLLSFSFTLVHCPGVLHVLPDALSRCYDANNLNKNQPEGDLTWERSDGQPAHVKSLKLPLHELVKYPNRVLAKFIKQRLSKTCPSPDQQKTLLENEHNSGHFGAEITYRKLWNLGYFWPEMHKQCVEIVANCEQCLRYNVAREGFNLMQSVSAKYPFDHVAMDLATMNPVSPRGHCYVFVLVDICTRYVVLHPLLDKKATSIARCLWEKVITVFGPPKIIQSDNGSEFVNVVLKALSQLMGIDHRLVAPYNPRANGAAERFVRSFKSVMKKIIKGNLPNFDLYLPTIQMVMNNKRSPLTGSAPSSLVLARPINRFEDYSQVEENLLSPDDRKEVVDKVLELIHPESFSKVLKSQSKTQQKVNKKRKIVKPYKAGSSVMITDVKRKNKNEPAFVGPYTILSRNRGGTYNLLDATNQLLPRKVPTSQIKLISGPENLDDLADIRYEVEKVLKHRGPEGKREYLVKWKNYSSNHNTWEPEKNFDDISLITRYWSTQSKQ